MVRNVGETEYAAQPFERSEVLILGHNLVQEPFLQRLYLVVERERNLEQVFTRVDHDGEHCLRDFFIARRQPMQSNSPRNGCFEFVLNRQLNRCYAVYQVCTRTTLAHRNLRLCANTRHYCKHCKQNSHEKDSRWRLFYSKQQA